MFSGMDVSTPDGLMKLRCLILMAAVDLPARAILLNMNQFNGKHGCSFCEHEGVTMPGSHLVRIWPPAEGCPVPSRNHQSVMQNVHKATASKAVVSNSFIIL